MTEATPKSRSVAEIKRNPIVVHDETLLLDTARFEQMQRIAAAMSSAKLVPKQEMEETMLDFVPDQEPTSRLSCQIKVTAELNGLVVRIPTSQH